MKKMIVLFLLLVSVGILYGQEWHDEGIMSYEDEALALKKYSYEVPTIYFFPPEEPSILIKKEIIDGKLELTLSQYHVVTFIYPVYRNDGSVSDNSYTEQWKEIYVAKDGEIVLEKTLMGKYRQKKVTKEVIEQELYYEENTGEIE